MKHFFQLSISAMAMAAMILSGVVATVSISAAPAFSKGNDNGNGNRDDDDDRDDDDRDDDDDDDRDDDDDDRNKNNNCGGRDNDNGRGATASSLGALNAAHANANALAKASVNSRVGMIAIYKLAVEATAEISAALDVAESALDTFIVQCGPDATESSLTVEECQGLLDAATESAQLAAEEGVVVDPFTYETYMASLELTVEDAGAAKAEAKALEDLALEAAANKVTNDEVIAALWDLLELPTL